MSVVFIYINVHAYSMLAVRSGAARVYACELNTTMVTVSHDILASNGMADKVAIIHKTSTEATIPADLPERYVLTIVIYTCICDFRFENGCQKADMSIVESSTIEL